MAYYAFEIQTYTPILTYTLWTYTPLCCLTDSAAERIHRRIHGQRIEDRAGYGRGEAQAGADERKVGV
jgi:hypothetical protein